MSTQDDDLAREIQAHIDLEADRLIEEGLSPDRARQEARGRFGNATVVRETCYEARRSVWMDHLQHDVRTALRSVRRYPLAAAVAMLSLAAGIGATTATLTVRDAVFRRPPPLYQEPAQLSRVQVGSPERPIAAAVGPVPAPLYAIWQDTLGTSIAASLSHRGAREIRVGDRTETVPLRSVSPHLFELLGVSPVLGRPFAAAVLDESGAPHAILSFRVWQRLLDARPDAVGASIWVDDQPYTIVGVMPERFWVGDMSAAIWTPLDVRSLEPDQAMEVVVRRTPGVTPAMLEAQLQSGLAAYADRLPAAERQLRLRVFGVEGTPLGHQVALALPYVLATAALSTLLIACANVAVLMIAQWTAREHEIAIRASIGASRGRIIRTLLTESVLIAAAAGLLGVWATFALRGWIVRHDGQAMLYDLSIDPAILALTAAVVLFTGILAGLGPAISETRRLHTNPLMAIGGSDRVRQRWRSALVIFEIAVTVALLVVTASMVDGYRRARATQLGYATGPLLSARIDNPAGVPTAAIRERVRQIPGVAEAAAATVAPPFMGAPQERTAADRGGSNPVVASRMAIGPEFFPALGVPMRAGRGFSAEDSTGPAAAVVNETLARRLFQAQSPLGSYVWVGGTPYAVVGVVADYALAPLHPAHAPMLFLPLPPDTREFTRMSLMIRADGDPAALVQTVRREIQDIAAGTFAGVYTVDQVLEVMQQEILAGTAPLLPLATIGLLLTVAGIYGILAFAVTRRSREIALRMAIGATTSDVARLVGRQTASLVVSGAGIGIGVTFALSRIVAAGSSGRGSVLDPQATAFIVPLLLVLAVGAAAAWVPTRRAGRIDPATLLRSL